MSHSWSVPASLTGLLVLTLGASSANAEAPVKTVDLSRIGGRTPVPTDVNEDGVIVGSARISGTTHMIQISGSGVPEDLGRYNAADTEADAINDAGVIVGHTVTGSGASQRATAFTWSRARGYRPVNVPGARRVLPVDINNRGLIVANVEFDDKTANGPCVIDGENVTFLPELGHGPATATAINDVGTVVGYAPFGRIDHTVAWTAGDYVIQHLGTESVDSGANAVSESGLLVGLSGERAHIWSVDGSVSRDLGPGEAADINDLGEVVGWSKVGYGDLLLWRPGITTPVRLTTGRDVALIGAINNRGVVVGQMNGQIAVWTTDRL